MNISFIIITDSNKLSECLLQIRSIVNLNIPKYEIIICGKLNSNLKHSIKQLSPHVLFIDKTEAANLGQLGLMRNYACDEANYDNLVISDDDMLFTSSWYNQLLKNDTSFDILTTRVKLPDGTRFWDHCCYMSPTKGHIILNPDETDSHLYMSGGQSWIMKKYVFEKVRWDENIAIYSMSNLIDYNKGKHNEDTEYSLRCREYFNISHNHNIVVYHNDASYTSIGRVVRRRYNNAPNTWLNSILLPPEIMINFSMELLKVGLEAEAIDILRTVSISDTSKFDDIRSYIKNIENHYGGKLIDSEYSIENQEYQSLVASLSPL